MVILTEAEKNEMCEKLGKNLSKIRELLHLTQTELGYLCGFSRIRISQIETGRTRMSWSQLTSVMLICMMNHKTKEWFFENNILGDEFLSFIQTEPSGTSSDA